VWIEDVVVRKDLRGAGVGTALDGRYARWAGQRLARLQLLADRRNGWPSASTTGSLFKPPNMICLRADSPQGPQRIGIRRTPEETTMTKLVENLFSKERLFGPDCHARFAS